MLKTIGSSVTLAFRVNDYEVFGGSGAEAESGRSFGGSNASRTKSTKSKSWTKSGFNCTKYPKDKESIHPSHKPQRAGLIAKETPTNALDKYANFADIFSLILRLTNMLANWSMLMDSLGHLSHP